MQYSHWLKSNNPVSRQISSDTLQTSQLIDKQSGKRLDYNNYAVIKPKALRFASLIEIIELKMIQFIHYFFPSISICFTIYKSNSNQNQYIYNTSPKRYISTIQGQKVTK